MMRSTVAVATALATTLTLGGCYFVPPFAGGGPGPMPHERAIDDEFSMLDTAFLMMMIPHHEQAVEMSDIALRADGIDARVTQLATRIKQTQTAEIAIMQEWLDDAGMPGGGMPDMGPGHGGIVSESDMDALAAASGDEATRLFLEHMIEHHEGAIVMAGGVVSGGNNPEVIALAETMVSDQEAEIIQMRQILADL